MKDLINKLVSFVGIKNAIINKIAHKRTINVVLGGSSFAIIRLIASIMGYFQIGIVVRYLSPDKFGLWASVASFASVFAMFNFGFGSSLLNKLSKLNADKNDDESKKCFFSIFYAFCLLTLLLIMLVYLINLYVPWGVLFNTNNKEIIRNGSNLFIIFSILSLISIPLSFSDVVFYSRQESWWVSLFALLTSFLLLTSSIVLVYLRSSFMAVVVSMSLMPTISGILSFLYMLNRTNWKFVTVNINVIKRNVYELFPQGIQFLLIQISSLILLSIDTVIIGKTAGLANAGEYFLIKKIVFLFSTIYLSLFSPVWSCYTDAIHNNDYTWVKKMLNMSGGLTIISYVLFILLFMLFGDSFMYMWTGKHIQNTLLLSLLGMWGFLYSFASCYSIFLNSIGELKPQAFCLITGTVLLFPLSSYCSKLMGIYGVCLSWIIVTAFSALLNVIISYLDLFKIRKICENKNDQIICVDSNV